MFGGLVLCFSEIWIHTGCAWKTGSKVYEKGQPQPKQIYQQNAAATWGSKCIHDKSVREPSGPVRDSIVWQRFFHPRVGPWFHRLRIGVWPGAPVARLHCEVMFFFGWSLAFLHHLRVDSGWIVFCFGSAWFASFFFALVILFFSIFLSTLVLLLWLLLSSFKCERVSLGISRGNRRLL